MSARPPTPAPRARRSPLAFGVALGLVAAACADDVPTAPQSPRALQAAAAAAPVLTWLAPLGTGTADPATFDSTAAPVVEVCAWTGAACDGPPVARFTTAPAAGELPLTVNAAAGRYEGDWNLTDARFTSRRTYRVRVLQGATEVGAQSVDAVRGRWALTRSDGTLAPLQAASTLPIRFHLARGTRVGSDSLPGDPAGPVGPAIPDRRYIPRAEDYDTTHPELPGVPVSFNVLWLAFADGTTVGQANALLAEIRAEIVGGLPGSSVHSGLLFLRVPTTTHAQMEALLDRLRADPRVFDAVQDVLLGADAVPRPSADVPVGDSAWTWELVPGGGNWGMELLRTPQLWNLNAAVCKVLRRDAPAIDCARPDPNTFGTAVPRTGVLDAGFFVHPDLTYTTLGEFGPEDLRFHGTHVTGIIGARFDNDPSTRPPGLATSRGVDGLNPLASVVTRRVSGSAGSAAAALTYEYFALIASDANIRVLNMSLGMNWSRADINPDTSRAVQNLMNREGRLFARAQENFVDRGGRLPAAFVSAGNDGLLPPTGPKDARWNSPQANAAIGWGSVNVRVVEALTLVSGARQVTELAGYSNQANAPGQLSAPGTRVVSTHLDHCEKRDASSNCQKYHLGDYARESGTSQAAPHVAGLAGYLMTLARVYGPAGQDQLRPTLGTNPLGDLLRASAVAGGAGAQPRVDAFNAALQLDVVLGGDSVLRKLLDVDDGTPDGNTRVNFDGTPNEDEDNDRDGGVGDGKVGMRDFRRWRDWLLAAEEASGLTLDGDARHPKKDVNANSRWAADGDDENVYPRGDFNGDGVLSRTARRRVAGRVDRDVTDLEVLRSRFDDPNYAPEDLPSLIQSADFALNTRACFGLTGVTRVRTHLWPAGGTLPDTGRTFGRADSVQVYTAPLAVGGAPRLSYAARVEALDAAGGVLATQDTTLTTPGLGGDVRWRPACIARDSAFVRGATNLWLAGQPDGTAFSGDAAPAHSPVSLLSPRDLAAGSALEFRADGILLLNGVARRDPDGLPTDFPVPDPGNLAYYANRLGPEGLGGWENGIAGTRARAGSLVGVFLGPDDPRSSPPPAPLDWWLRDNYTTTSPGLKQVFFIGDGRTGRLTGAQQRVIVPPGATRLYVGMMGSFTRDNRGGYVVTVRAAPAGAVASGSGAAARPRTR